MNRYHYAHDCRQGKNQKTSFQQPNDPTVAKSIWDQDRGNFAKRTHSRYEDKKTNTTKEHRRDRKKNNKRNRQQIS